MRDVLYCRCGKCSDCIVMSQDTVTVAVETIRGVVGRAQEENSTNIIIVPEEYIYSSKCKSRTKHKIVESSNLLQASTFMCAFLSRETGQWIEPFTHSQANVFVCISESILLSA